jgi:hypothetical protein
MAPIGLYGVFALLCLSAAASTPLPHLRFRIFFATFVATLVELAILRQSKSTTGGGGRKVATRSPVGRASKDRLRLLAELEGSNVPGDSSPPPVHGVAIPIGAADYQARALDFQRAHVEQLGAVRQQEVKGAQGPRAGDKAYRTISSLPFWSAVASGARHRFGSGSAWRSWMPLAGESALAVPLCRRTPTDHSLTGLAPALALCTAVSHEFSKIHAPTGVLRALSTFAF